MVSTVQIISVAALALAGILSITRGRLALRASWTSSLVLWGLLAAALFCLQNLALTWWLASDDISSVQHVDALIVSLLLVGLVFHVRNLSVLDERSPTCYFVGFVHVVMAAAGFSVITLPYIALPKIVAHSNEVFSSLGMTIVFDLLSTLIFARTQQPRYPIITTFWLAGDGILMIAISAIADISIAINTPNLWLWTIALGLFLRSGIVLLPILCAGMRDTSILLVSALTFSSNLIFWRWMTSFDWPPLLIVLWIAVFVLALFLAAFTIRRASTIRVACHALCAALSFTPILFLAFPESPTLMSAIVLTSLWASFAIASTFSTLITILSLDNRINATGGLVKYIPIVTGLHALTVFVGMILLAVAIAVMLIYTLLPLGLSALVLTAAAILFLRTIMLLYAIFGGSSSVPELVLARMRDIKGINGFAVLIVSVISSLITGATLFYLAQHHLQPFTTSVGLASHDASSLSIYFGANVLAVLILVSAAFISVALASKKSVAIDHQRTTF